MKNQTFSLSEEAKEAQREYKKRWRAKNPDKVRESNRKYWERKAQKQVKKEEIGNYANADD